MTDSKARVRFIEQAIAAQEEERARIARELHDGIGQSLTSMLVGLRSLESSLPEDSDARKLASALRDTAGRAIDEVRTLAQGLRPTALDDLGLGPAVERLVEDMASRHRIALDLQSNGLDGDPRLPPSLEITVYRIVQEALHNVAKHANATSASVVLERREDLVRIIVEDDGLGMRDPEGGSGFGLQGIRERLTLVKGELTIESTPQQGTTLFATIPCRPRSPRRFSIVYGDHEVPLPPGEYVIGRSSECELQFERRRISRRHAKLMIGEYEAYVEDLGSMNGVFVNGRRAEGSVRLVDADDIVIGDEHLKVKSSIRAPGGNGPSWRAERTLPGIVPSKAKAKARDVTEKANMLEIAGMMALRWMDEGRAADAERVLSGHLRQVLESARAGQPVRASIVETSSSHALRLALATKNAGWVRYALELLERTQVMPSTSTAAALDRLRREGVEVPTDAMSSYLAAMEGIEPPSGESGFALEQLRKMVE